MYQTSPVSFHVSINVDYLCTRRLIIKTGSQSSKGCSDNILRPVLFTFQYLKTESIRNYELLVPNIAVSEDHTLIIFGMHTHTPLCHKKF
jgi:hypothetical protein